MMKKILSVLALVLILVMTSVISFATEGEVLPQVQGEETAPENIEGDIIVKSVDYDNKTGDIKIIVENKSSDELSGDITLTLNNGSFIGESKINGQEAVNELCENKYKEQIDAIKQTITSEAIEEAKAMIIEESRMYYSDMTDEEYAELVSSADAEITAMAPDYALNQNLDYITLMTQIQEEADAGITVDVKEMVFTKNYEVKAGEEFAIFGKIVLDDGEKMPKIDAKGSYDVITLDANILKESEAVTFEYYDILNVDYKERAEATADSAAGSTKEISKSDAIMNFLKQTGFSMTNWQSIVMILIACILFYLAIVKKFEPLLLLPIAFGMLLTNLMGAEVFHEELFAGGHVHWDMFGGSGDITPGLIDILYLGVKLGIYPCLIFIGVGAMTDFGPLIANPKSLLLGAAAQGGIFATFLGALALGFTQQQAGSIGIIGGADGPTAIFVTSKLAPELLGPIAVAAYSYMALVPVIQPPIMKLLTTKKERQIEMKALRPVSQKEKIIFPIVVTIFVALLVPSAAPLVGCLMLGNLLKECGVCERLSKTVQNELMNIVTVFLGISVGATATASTFLSLETIKIIVMGVVAFGVATACGVLLAKFMNLFLKNKINPLIGSAGVSAVPMAARVSQVVGQKENPSNFLLMHAMGPNVAGVIGSAIAAGALIAMLG